MPMPNALLNFDPTDDERKRRGVEETLRAGAFSRGVTPSIRQICRVLAA